MLSHTLATIRSNPFHDAGDDRASRDYMPLCDFLLTLGPRRSPVTPSSEGGKSSLRAHVVDVLHGQPSDRGFFLSTSSSQGYIFYSYILSDGCCCFRLRVNTTYTESIPDYSGEEDLRDFTRGTKNCRSKLTYGIHYVLAPNHIVFIF